MVELSTRISKSCLVTIKAYLRTKLSDVKSSHRCEAIARGLGFNTYAALLAGIRNEETVQVSVFSDAFSGYLRERGLAVSSAPFIRSVAQVALHWILEVHPELTSDGMGVYARHSWGQEALEAYEARRSESRADMYCEKAIDRFLLSLEFVQRIPKTKTIRGAAGYRRLKHIAEKMPASFPDGEKLGPQYLPAGFLLAAAIHAGFKWQKVRGLDGRIGPEVRFNMLHSAVMVFSAEFSPK